MKQIKLEFGDRDYRTEESFKGLRTNIMLTGIENKVIAITSCTPNEGKSTVSMFLAKALAESGKKVLLIDGDLRKSILSKYIQTYEEPKGLSHFLSGLAEINEVMYSTQIDNLFLVMPGTVPPNPAELLEQARFEAFIKGARKKFDYIIIDTPPLGNVIDAAIITNVCDGVALVISSGEISYRFARNIRNQIEKTNCQILGVVLNKVDTKIDKRYGKYYGSYGDYGDYYNEQKKRHREKKKVKR